MLPVVAYFAEVIESKDETRLWKVLLIQLNICPRTSHMTWVLNGDVRSDHACLLNFLKCELSLPSLMENKNINVIFFCNPVFYDCNSGIKIQNIVKK